MYKNLSVYNLYMHIFEGIKLVVKLEPGTV